MAIWLGAMVQHAKKGLQALLGLALITALFVIVAPSYRSWGALTAILEQSSVLATMAVGTAVVLIGGWPGPVGGARFWR